MESNEDFIRAKLIFEQAVELPSDVRGAFIQRVCASNTTLYQRVSQMLAHFEKASATFDPVISEHSERRAFSLGDIDFSSTPRFRVERRLGSGSFGTVYEVFDNQRRAKLALKVLNRPQPDSLYRFKQEFRSLSQLKHEHLVELYELIADGERWFFTMELVDGVDFFDFVRPNERTYDIQRLRDALRQLIMGVQALHRSNHIHRDLKPANVLVTKNGRVVVLDFGLIRHLSPERSALPASFVGTPAYMSPEQALGRPLNPSSDWYSVGVMLFEVLTGRLPPNTFLDDKFQTSAIQEKLEPRTINPQVPEELNEICRQMLDPFPGNRPNGEAILQFLGTGPSQSLTEPVYPEEVGIESFVGRGDQLASMEAAFASTLMGQLSVVLIEGPSGIGKSTLVRRFLSDVLHNDPRALILSGRCHEFESVPYKGLDALIDQLSQHLQQLTNARVQALLPREASLLRRLFPVLGRVPAIADAPMSADSVPDAQELRQRTFAALREMLARLGDRCPLVIWIDDLQWGDRDSSSFLAELCAPPLPPPLLLLLTYRSEEEVDRNSTLQYLNRVFSTENRVLGHWRHLNLKGLSDEESRNLLAKLLNNKASNKACDKAMEKIVSEAQGHPYYLQELAHGFSQTEERSEEIGKQDLELRSFLQRRISELPVFSRELLELICLAVQPISLSIVFAASISNTKEDQPDALSVLIRAHLARISGGEGEKRVEPYHDQVRSVVVGMLSPNVAEWRHAQLAKSLARDPNTEPQTLVTHYKGARDFASALEAALKAAGAAESQLAFDRAATFYQAALDTGVVEDARKADLYQRLADCLGKAGRGWDSAQAYLKAEVRDGNDSLEMDRLAAEQLMRSGHVDQAMVLFKKLCSKIGLTTPGSPRSAINGIVYWRLITRLRLVFGSPKPSPDMLARANMTRLEVLRAGGVIMYTADPVFASYFQSRYVYEALGNREPHHLAAALALEAGFRAAPGARTPEKSLRLLQRAEEIAKTVGSSNTMGFVYLCRAYLDHLSGRIPQGIEDSRFAIEFIRGHCTGMAWELTASHVLYFWFTLWAGYMGELRDLFPQLLREGASHGDVNVEDSLRFLSYYHLGADHPDECLKESLRVLDSPGDFHLQHYGAALTCVETYLYLGDYAAAREQLVKAWVPMSKSFILRRQIFRILAYFLRGRVALACWLADRHNSVLRSEVEDYAKRIRRIRSAWCQPMTSVLIAGLAVGDGNRSEGVRALDEAHNGFEKIPLHGYASASSYVSGLLRGDEKGFAQVQRAQEFLKTHNFQNPAAFLRMLIPGQWM
jgi:serine/threonine protein kinase/tetratricopeptide (TPR) repeat protein